MGIKKQEFYEGAALHLLARSGLVTSLRYEPPFFEMNGHTTVLLKYSTKGRSPWGFTFMPDEQVALREKAGAKKLVIGMVCGSDGVASLDYTSYLGIAGIRDTALHISCYRNHGEHYEVSGPDGTLGRKIAPSIWQRILKGGDLEDESR